MRLLRFLGIWAVLLAMARGASTAEAPASVKILEEGGQASRFSFRVETPALRLVPDASGRVEIALDGFGVVERRPGAPDIPTKIVRVALPPGVVPRVVVGAVHEDFVRGLRPRAVAKDLVEIDPVDPLADPDSSEREGFVRGVRRTPVRRDDPELFDRGGAFPAKIVSIGSIGTLRAQRYVELTLAPIRWDAQRRALRVARSFDVTVHFEGDDLQRGSPAEDLRFESVYRGTFLNYGQGRTFRADDSSQAVSLASRTPMAGGPAYKIRVRQNGVVRIDQARVAGTGLDTQPLSQWKLANRGVEVPLHVRDSNGNDALDSGDWVQFYGQALDDEAKAVLSFDIAGVDNDIYEARDFTDENLYFLTSEGGPRARVAVRDAAPTNVRIPATDFESVAHIEQDSPDGFRPLGPHDPWYWTPAMISNGATSRTIGVPLPGLASGTAAVRVLTKLRGLSESASVFPDHRTRVTLQNATNQVLQADDDNGAFDGRKIYTHDFTWTYPGSGATLTQPANVRVEVLPIATGQHQVILDWVEILYRRTFQASSDVLTFDWPDGNSEFVVSGLTSSSPSLYEITGRVDGTGVAATQQLTGGTVSGTGPFSIRFRVDDDPALPNGTPRRFVVAGDGAVAVPANPDFFPDTVSDLRNNAIQADMVVIANGAVLNQGPGSVLEQFLAHKAANGISTKVVLLEDLYDEFNDGLPGPVAIRSFLRWVMSSVSGEGWAAPKPSYVLLLGDGSYDFKAGLANGNIVPTALMFKDEPEIGSYASDSLLGAVVGDDLQPDLVVGRLPGRSAADIDALLEKTLGYEQSPDAGNWRRHALFISDEGKNGDTVEGLDFEAMNDEAAAYLKRPPHTTRRLRYQTDFGGSGPTVVRDEIIDALEGLDGVSDGAGIVQYSGHGSYDFWSSDLLWDDRTPRLDTESLDNPGKLPWLLVHNCLSGGFQTVAARSLGESWVKREGGGAIALFSPSGLSFNFVGRAVIEEVWGGLFGARKERTIGVPVLDSWTRLCGQGTIEGCQNYVLLGDPSLRLVYPEVKPATAVVATPGNAQVTLNWAHSATSGVTYDVYRATVATGPYVAAGSTTQNTFLDTGRINANPYFYYIVARDGTGFESRWSNFNSDCGVSGPDCVQATPTNPNPPAVPTGLAVTDPESGSKLNLTWNANVESDLKHYEVRYGTTPGSYPNVVNVGKNTSSVLSGLQNNTTYYIVITATNTSLRTSAPSAERSGTPTFVRGTKSPDFIGTLRVDRSVTNSANAVLSWTAVTTDIYGKPETIAKYEIFRGTTPGFVPGPASKIGETTGTSYTDVSALLAGGPSYHWLVRAVDIDGNPGGLGAQLPNGIDTLLVTKSGTQAGWIVLSWPAVTTDFDGNPTRIDHYEVYGRSTPFRRTDVRNGTIPQIVPAVPGTSIEFSPAAGAEYYSVIVVDAKGNKSSF